MKLNLGAGRIHLEGYLNLDGANGDKIYPLDYVHIEEIRASHVLEHFGHIESVEVLISWYDALKVGGVLKIAVPDFDDLVRRKALGQVLPYEEIIMGGQVDERDYHKSLWTYDKLRYLLDRIGFTDIKTWQSEIADCASYEFSLNLQGVKE